jgi:holliday junction DNA helicase RuvA
MIASLQGQVTEIFKQTLTLDVNKVGYEVFCPQPVLSKLTPGEETYLYIHTHVREDQFTLFGFNDNTDRNLFRQLISVSGIGPKIALSILNYPSTQISRAIMIADVSFFTGISGVGKKGAQKIIVELKSKLGSLNELDLQDKLDDNELNYALISLGYKPQEIQKIIKQIPSELTTLESQLKYALQNLK